jgi:hypothetical protein
MDNETDYTWDDIMNYESLDDNDKRRYMELLPEEYRDQPIPVAGDYSRIHCAMRNAMRHKLGEYHDLRS